MITERTHAERTARLDPDATHVFDLQATLYALRQEAPYAEHGKNGITLVKTPDLRLVLEVLRAGARLAPHHAPGPITVQVLAGELRFETPTAVLFARRGEVIALPPGVRHAVEAVEESAYLLSIAPLPRPQPADRRREVAPLDLG